MCASSWVFCCLSLPSSPLSAYHTGVEQNQCNAEERQARLEKDVARAPSVFCWFCDVQLANMKYAENIMICNDPYEVGIV